MNTKEWKRSVYYLAGLVNIIGVPIFSKLFTNDYLSNIDPGTFSRVGLIAIVLWGMAYAAAADNYKKMPYISLVFGIEKIFYGTVWIIWMKGHFHEIPLIFKKDCITGLFYSVYGINDLLFGIFFLYMFFGAVRNSHE